LQCALQRISFFHVPRKSVLADVMRHSQYALRLPLHLCVRYRNLARGLALALVGIGVGVGWHRFAEDGGVVRSPVAGCCCKGPVPRRLVSAVSSLVMQIRTIIQFLQLIFSYAHTVHTVEYRYRYIFINIVDTGCSLSSFKQSKRI